VALPGAYAPASIEARKPPLQGKAIILGEVPKIYVYKYTTDTYHASMVTAWWISFR
jgi:hypothetical protein